MRAHRARARGAPRAAASSTRRRATRCAPATTCAGCRGSCGGRATGTEAAAVGDRAIAVLEAFPDSRELAMALSGALAARDARPSATRRRSSSARAPMRLARADRRPRDRHPRADQRRHGAARQRRATSAGARCSRRRSRSRREDGHDDHAARALVNLATGDADAPPRRRARSPATSSARCASPRERELDGYVQYLLGVRADLRLLRGDWARGGGRRARLAGARRAARRQPVPGADRARPPAGAPRRRRAPATTLDGRVAARGGDRRAAAARPGGGGARRARVARRRPRARSPRSRGPAYELAADARRRLGARRARVLAVARRRAGRAARPTTRSRTPLAMAGDWRGAAAAWERLGFPTSAPRRSRDADDEDGAAGGARAASTRSARCARRVAPAPAAARRRRAADPARAARRPRGPGPAGLTPRETEVLELIVRGRDQRRDRPRAGDLAQDGRPPRLRGAGQARRRARGARPEPPPSASTRRARA